MLEEVAFTWKLIKQFHVRANATGQIPNVKTRILLTNHGHKKAQKHKMIRTKVCVSCAALWFTKMRWRGRRVRAKMICFCIYYDYV